MADILFEAKKGDSSYSTIRTGDGRLLLQERRHGCRPRSYRITRPALESILAAGDRYAACADAYHEARLRRKARRRATGGNKGDQLVPAV